MNQRIVVKNGVVRFIDTGLIPEAAELADLVLAEKILTKEEQISNDTRAWEMVEV